MADRPKKRGCFRVVVTWAAAVLVALLLIAAIVFGVVFREALYNRLYLFPKQAKAWESIRAHRIDTVLNDGWNEYRGVMHSHSELSHDSKIPFPEILGALKKADVNFIFMTDHCVDGKGDYSKGWKGLHDGILFVRGFEMDEGFMPWGLPDSTVLDCGGDPALRAKQIKDLGGVLFFAHCEEERPWDLPELTGMEIYNIHTDLKGKDIKKLAPNVALSLWSYPDQAFRLVFSRPQALIVKWDDLNRTRKITGIAANDCHQNNGVIATYTAKDTLRLADTGHPTEVRYEMELNFATRSLLRVLFGRLEPDRQVFRVDLDPYERSARFVNTHLLAKECSEPALLDALRQSRVFIAFDMIADARGFKFLAEAPPNRVVMGESIALSPDLKFRMASPHACRFTIVRDGTQVAQLAGNTFDWQVPEPGKYRVEAELDVLGEWTPWVYTNPIEVTRP